MNSPYPLWVRLVYSGFVAVLVPAYWQGHGPGNFLWFSDISLFAMLVALWARSGLIASMVAVGVLPLEVIWVVDFIGGGSIFGIAAYMFDSAQSLYLRGLSLFHLFLPPVIVWMLIVERYDTRALWAQTIVAWIVLLLSRRLTTAEENVNWVYGLGPDAATTLPSLAYLAIYMVLLPLLVFVPMHFALRWLFPRGRPRWRALARKTEQSKDLH